jgi:DNA-binding NtrC family response regulator
VLSPRDFKFLDRATRVTAAMKADRPVPVDEHLRRQIELFGDRMTESELADALGISRKTLWKKRREWGLK